MTAAGDPCFCCDKPLREFVCVVCDKTYFRHMSGGPKPIYCSERCRRVARKKVRLAKENAET